MRDIKFRVWDTLEKTMNVMFIGVTANGSLMFHGLEHSIPQKNSRCRLMQYTGLQDKNGEDIWEGDIVELFSRKNNAPINTQAVVWIESMGCWNLSSLLIHNEMNCQLDEKTRIDFRVVGNIYENSEIAKEAQYA